MTSDDFPTFGRPTIAMRGSGSSAFCSSDLLFGQPLDDFVEEIADALPVLRGDLHHRLEPQLVEIERARFRALVVGLVDRDDDRAALCANRLRDFEIGRHQPLAAVDDEHEQRRIFERAPAMLEHLLLKRILALAEHAGRVGQQKRHVAPVGRAAG